MLFEILIWHIYKAWFYQFMWTWNALFYQVQSLVKKHFKYDIFMWNSVDLSGTVYSILCYLFLRPLKLCLYKPMSSVYLSIPQRIVGKSLTVLGVKKNFNLKTETKQISSVNTNKHIIWKWTNLPYVKAPFSMTSGVFTLCFIIFFIFTFPNQEWVLWWSKHWI